jgi:hypothetical protein
MAVQAFETARVRTHFHNSLEASLADDTQDMPMYDAERERLIRELAYQLWESEGRPEGREEEYWHRARERTQLSKH